MYNGSSQLHTGIGFTRIASPATPHAQNMPYHLQYCCINFHSAKQALELSNMIRAPPQLCTLRCLHFGASCVLNRSDCAVLFFAGHLNCMMY